MNDTVQQIPLDQIRPNEWNRKHGGFNKAKLRELAESVKAVGVLHPALVRIKPDVAPHLQPYELVAGERRWKAASLAGLTTLPCVVREVDDATLMKIQTIENLQREDIHPLDEADGYARLIERGGYDVEKLAKEIGKSISYVYQRLKLRELIPPARQMMIDGRIQAGHAVLIARLPPGQQGQVLKSYAFQRGEEVSVREIMSFIQNQVLLDLSKATFKRDDAELDPRAGPCTTCPKRTGYQPALFADVCNPKHDYCLDPPCYQGKTAALVQRRRVELKESGEKFLEVADGYVDYREEQQLKKAGVKEKHAWEECKKKDPEAKPALVVAGDSPGQLTWGKERKENRYSRYEPTAAEKRAAEKQRLEGKIKSTVRRRLWDTVIEKLAGKGVFREALSEEILRMVALRLWERTWDNHRSLYCKTVGWERPPKKKGEYSTGWEPLGNRKIGAMPAPELRQFLVTCSVIGDMDIAGYGIPAIPKQLNFLAGLVRLDPKSLEAKVRLELEEKAKKKAPAKKAEASAK